MTIYSKIDIMKWITEGAYSSSELRLFDDAKQLYELQLAKMEFLNFSSDLDEFVKRAAYFEEIFGKKSWHYYISSVKGKGQIGHTNQYMTHWFYPYKGKFHGQMIKALINFANARDDDVVLDPYLGSGTTLIESTLLELPGWGVEINPALAVISQIKLDALKINYPEFSKILTPDLINKAFKYFKNLKVPKNSIKPTVDEHMHAKDLLEILWDSYFPKSPLHDLPLEWRNILMLIYLHALSDYTYLKGTRKEKALQEFFHQNLKDYLRTLSGAYETINRLGIRLGNYEVIIGSTLSLPYKDNTVKAIVTSPPYSIALDYIKNDEHLLTYFGIDISALRDQMIGLKGKGREKLILYERDLKKSIEEMIRVLKPGGWAVIVLGDISINGTRTNFKEKILNWGQELGCQETFALERAILGGFARLRFEYLIFLQK
ncbi:DNA methyltransferase [Thermococcus barophilus]|uniref:site-specific DNA-methyltransferase (cytosine-N(4)-specific) n=1 Tax=Thermococcus barophilus TaxID=55802 RepID=A0A0S1XED1_THEBA|nr:DNA methyltransferase [Thermococcus barophilus]ALM76067.1 hypothetical protein TBCH5v1_2167 [Thermococcus barophilus]